MRGCETKEIEFLGLNFAEMDEGQALDWLLERSRESTFSYIVTPNVDHVVQLYRRPDLLDHVYDEAHLRLCDSRVIALMARWNRMELPFVTGSGLTARMLSKPLRAGTTIAMVGGNAHQRAWLSSMQPDAQIFYHEPPMGLRTNLAAQVEAAEFVESVRADIVLLTVGAPQSEMIASLIHSRGKARGVALCVGASLEFITGEKRRAPEWMQELALEWAFRLCSEPRRLARRYLVDGPRIFSIWRRWMKAAPGTLRPAAARVQPALVQSAWEPEIVVEPVKVLAGYEITEEVRLRDTVAPDVVRSSLLGS